MGVTRGGRGSNQYKIKGVSRAAVARRTFVTDMRAGLRDLAEKMNETKPTPQRER